jgi:hypothetical protein
MTYIITHRAWECSIDSSREECEDRDPVVDRRSLVEVRRREAEEVVKSEAVAAVKWAAVKLVAFRVKLVVVGSPPIFWTGCGAVEAEKQ